MVTTRDKILLTIALFSVGGVVTVFAKNSSSTSNKSTNDNSSTESNMNSGKADTKANRGNTTYAVFNKNPLNVKVQVKDGVIQRLYPGEITADGAMFKMFNTWTNGTAGVMIHLWRYLNGKITGDVYPTGTKLNTIEKIIRTWAPVTDGNDTEGYIDFVAENSGFSRTKVLTWSKDDITALVDAMKEREDRKAAKFLTPQILSDGWDIANQWIIKNT